MKSSGQFFHVFVPKKVGVNGVNKFFMPYLQFYTLKQMEIPTGNLAGDSQHDLKIKGFYSETIETILTLHNEAFKGVFEATNGFKIR